MERVIWTPYKDLFETLKELISNESPALFKHAKDTLQKHKPEFYSLMKNVDRSSDSRSKVQNSQNAGLIVGGESTPKTLNETFINEALAISDLFELNELSCVDLLILGEQQMANYPNYGRPLVSVLLYWDGKRNIVNSLRTLIQCRMGRMWTLGLSDEASAFATKFTDDILANGMVEQILGLLAKLNVDSEVEKLNKPMFLDRSGITQKHIKQIRDIIAEVHLSLAECLFYFSGQSGLPLSAFTAAMQYLKTNAALDSDGRLTASSVAVLFAVLHAISIQTPGNLNDELNSTPLLTDKKFIQSAHKLIAKDSSHTTTSSAWKVPGVLSCIQFAWSLTLAQIPSNASVMESSMASILEQDEATLDMALAGQVFVFMKDKIVACDNFFEEEFYIRKLHGLLCDLIINMPLKIKEIRSHGDEVARIAFVHLMEGEEPPSELRKDFQQMLDFMTALYDKDPLELQPTADYWSPADNYSVYDGESYMASPQRFQQHRRSQKQASLHKFVRLSGDLLPPLLYIPHLRMLAALSTGAKSARQCFTMLHMNDSCQDGGNISWSHFFLSCHRYYEHLQDRPASHDVTNPMVTHNVTHSSRSITPHEVDGLRAVMNLIAKICQYDEIACLTIYNNMQWSACGVLYGLLQCPIPVGLKGDILTALSYIAQVPEVAVGMMQITENAQLLVNKVNPFKVQGKSLGFQSELEEVESRAEEYPMSRGFLKLLNTLATVPSNLLMASESDKNPIFTRYLHYVIESIFLKFSSRAYARSQEKWEVASGSFEIFNKLLSHYQPHVDHFVNSKHGLYDSINESSMLETSLNASVMSQSRMQQQKVACSPGFYLLLYTYNEGPFFKIIMDILDSCLTYLDSHKVDFKLESTLIQTASLALDLILKALGLQDSFLSTMRESGRALLLSGLDKLLLSVSPTSGKADFIINILRFMTHHTTHPLLALQSCKIVSWLCFSSVSTQRDVVKTIISSCSSDQQVEINQAFVEILDTVCEEPANNDVISTAPMLLIGECRIVILRLLVHCINFPAPNLSHFLLGFDVKRSPSTCNLQDPGVSGARRTSLHSILNILSTENPELSQPACITDTPLLAELCYHLVFKMYVNMETTSPILRYFRSSYDFICKHLQYLPFKTIDESKSNHALMQQSWLLRSVAIEIYSLVHKQQRSNAQRVIQLLFKACDTEQPAASSFLSSSLLDISNLSTTAFASTTMFNNSTLLDTSRVPQSQHSSGGNLKMINILDILELTQEYPDTLLLEQFIPNVVEDGIKSCETVNEHGVVFCDIKMLHRMIESSLDALQGSDDATRRRLAAQDIKNILANASERNLTRETVHSKLSFLTSWKQVTEVVVTSCFQELLQKHQREQILLNLLSYIVRKVQTAGAIQELTSPLATALFIVFVQSRMSIAGIQAKLSFFPSSVATDEDKDLNAKHTAQLQVVVRGIIQWLLQSGLAQKVRTYLYASLLTYLLVCQRPKHKQASASTSFSMQEDVYSKVSRDNVKLLREYGEPFMNLLCKDACSGHSICRVLAFACLDAIVQSDHNQTWIQYMTTAGYITNIANSFREDDRLLQQALASQSTPRCMYIYEQKMALLCSIVQSATGARAVLDSGILERLSECEFYDMRPTSDTEQITSEHLQGYRQILFPAMNLCSGLLATLGGSKHSQGCAIVLQFILSHAEAFINDVLRPPADLTDVENLTELKLLTNILSQTASQDFTDADLFGNIREDVLMEIQAYLTRIQRQMLAILPCCFLSDKHLSDLKQEINTANEGGNLNLLDKIQLTLFNIGSNILGYCRKIAIKSATDVDANVLMFSPVLSETTASMFYDRPSFSIDDRKMATHLGLLVHILQTATARLTENNDATSPQHLDEVRTSLYYSVENCLLLLWQHLDYYVIKAVPVDVTTRSILFPKQPTSNRQSFRRLDGTTSDSDLTEPPYKKAVKSIGIKKADIAKLKEELPIHLPDRFLKSMANVTVPNRNKSFVPIVPSLVRRIQHIINLHTK